MPQPDSRLLSGPSIPLSQAAWCLGKTSWTVSIELSMVQSRPMPPTRLRTRRTNFRICSNQSWRKSLNSKTFGHLGKFVFGPLLTIHPRTDFLARSFGVLPANSDGNKQLNYTRIPITSPMPTTLTRIWQSRRSSPTVARSSCSPSRPGPEGRANTLRTEYA